MANEIGKVRRSAVLANFAPGAVADFRSGRAAISGVIAGLEDWDRSASPAGLVNPQVIHEPRLERSLDVKGFRLPFVIDEDWRDKDGNPDMRRLVAARMPRWLQCPVCERIALAQHWSHDPGRAERFCPGCNRQQPLGDRRYCVPVRFVFACDNGHLDEFPWHRWVGHQPECQERQFLHLTSRGPGLAGLILTCPRCKSSRSMDGIFSEETWNGYTCSGRRPWLAGADENCARRPRAVQRGASNLYFPVIASALSIPPWSDELQEQLGIYWDPIIQVDPTQRAQFIDTLAKSVLAEALRNLGLTAETLAREIARRLEILARPEILDIRGEEYRQFSLGTGGDAANGTREFECRAEPVPDALEPYFDRILRVVRLREVRALRGFTRINPPGDENGADMAPLSSDRMDWLPGIEVRGEGIFLKLAEAQLSRWESGADVQERAARVNAAWHSDWHERQPDNPPPYDITARYLLVHTLAHALMRQLTLDCGYSSAALRERLYVDGGDAQMAGLLIYTSTSDTDGTLGGLERQGTGDRLACTIPAALRAIEWCSSDPLCIGDMMGGADGLSLAACHACVLAPETACETFNRFLDRAMLIGTADDRHVGFFAPLLTGA